jgi:uncharacterized membrane protein YphA (DoxX/SURF4 family)
MFSAFPNGWPGAGLLLLRAAAGAALVVQGAAYFADARYLKFTILAIAFLTVVSGALLLIGYLTPFASILAAIASLDGIFSWFPAPKLDLFEAKLAAALAAAIAAALVCLGPGAFSLDARLFGRREIVISDSSRPPER